MPSQNAGERGKGAGSFSWGTELVFYGRETERSRSNFRSAFRLLPWLICSVNPCSSPGCDSQKGTPEYQRFSGAKKTESSPSDIYEQPSFPLGLC